MRVPSKIAIGTLSFALKGIIAASLLFAAAIISAIVLALIQPQAFLSFIGITRPNTPDWMAYFFAAFGVPMLVVLAKGAYPAIKLVYMRSTRLPSTLWASISLFTEADGARTSPINVHDVFHVQVAGGSELPVRHEFADGFSSGAAPGTDSFLMLGLVDHPASDYSSLQPTTTFRVIVQGRVVGRGLIIGTPRKAI